MFHENKAKLIIHGNYILFFKFMIITMNEFEFEFPNLRIE